MLRRIKYNKGDALNSKGTLYIEECSKLIQPSGQTKRRALFLCPRCKKNTRPWFSQEDLKQIKNRDSIKNDYCQYHFIPLFRIPFYDINKLNWQYLERRLNSCICF